MKAIIDCNSFYCSCERVFNPALNNSPVVVLSNNDGCIVSRTDEAKALGIPMGIPYFQARVIIEKNGVAVFSSNYGLYGDMSIRVMNVLKSMVGENNVEVYSVDEAFINLDSFLPEGHLHIGAELRDKIRQWTGIETSVGIAPTKTIAKMANNLAKKDKKGTECLMVLDSSEKISSALANTGVGEVWGIGRRYANKLREDWCIYSAADLAQRSPDWASKNLGGVVGVRLLKELNGEPCISMKDPLEKKKMIATTRMFGKAVYTRKEIREAVSTYAARAAEKLRRQDSAAVSIEVFVVVKVPDPNGGYKEEYLRGFRTLTIATSATHELIRNAAEISEEIFRPGGRYIKSGVILGGLVPGHSVQSGLFGAGVPDRRARKLMEAVDNINFSMRNDVLRYAGTGLERNWKMRQEHRSGRYSTRWEELRTVN